VTLPGAVAPVGIALRVTEAHKLLRHGSSLGGDKNTYKTRAHIQ